MLMFARVLRQNLAARRAGQSAGLNMLVATEVRLR